MVFGEKTLTGTLAIRLIEHADFPERNVFGALFYEGKDDSDDEMVTKFKDGVIFTEQNKYAVSILKKELAELIFPEPSKELIALINSLKSIGEKRQETVDYHLASIGFPIHLGVASLEDKEFVCSLVNRDNVPMQSERGAFFEIVKKTSNFNWSSRFFEKWLREIESQFGPEAVGRFHLTYVFRHTGKLKEALRTSVVVEFPKERFKCTPGLRSVLATLRAATFLDIYEQHNDRDLLLFARKTIGISWRINQSDEASNVYQRLKKFEKELEEEDYKQKVNQAFSDWANW